MWPFFLKCLIFIQKDLIDFGRMITTLVTTLEHFLSPESHAEDGELNVGLIGRLLSASLNFAHIQGTDENRGSAVISLSELFELICCKCK